jgi:hypothetical protein
MKSIICFLIIILVLNSCDNDTNQITESKGVPTILKGKVADDIRGLNIENYKIKLIKSWRCCSNFMCGWCSEEIATVYTDKNGYYEIKFDYKIKEGESYVLEEQYYGVPYLPEYKTKNIILAGIENMIDINAWKPIIIKINLNVKNNNTPPLITGLNYKNNYTFGTENTYEKEKIKTFEIRTRPNSNITIDFWYNENYNSSNPIRHLKSIAFKTDLSEITELNYEIDCSKF